MLASIEISTWQCREALEKLSPEEYEKRRMRWPQIKMPEAQDKLKNWYSSENIFVDEFEMAQLVDDGFKFDTKKVRGVMNMGVPLHKNVYQISVANVGLLMVQAVDVLEDCCTEALQVRLDDGWRILAVCPPNDARRPTYIIGHADKEKKK